MIRAPPVSEQCDRRWAARPRLQLLEEILRVDLTPRLFHPTVAAVYQIVKVLPELRAIPDWDLEPNKHSADVRAVVSVMEERDVHLRRELLQEPHESSGLLRELKSEQRFLRRFRCGRAAA